MSQFAVAVRHQRCAANYRARMMNQAILETSKFPLEIMPSTDVKCLQVDRNATVEIKISDDNRQAHFDFEG